MMNTNIKKGERKTVTRLFSTDKDIVEVNSTFLSKIIEGTVKSGVGIHFLNSHQLAKVRACVKIKQMFLKNNVEDEKTEYEELEKTKKYLSRFDKGIYVRLKPESK